MIEYFLLQLTTIALEIQYEKYKSWHVHIKTYILVFLLSFILFIYFTISFSRFFKAFDFRKIGFQIKMMRLMKMKMNKKKGEMQIKD